MSRSDPVAHVMLMCGRSGDRGLQFFVECVRVGMGSYFNQDGDGIELHVSCRRV